MTPLTMVGAAGQEVVVEYVAWNGVRGPREGCRTSVITALCVGDVSSKSVEA